MIYFLENINRYVWIILLLTMACNSGNAQPVYHSLYDARFSPKGDRLAVSDASAGKLFLLSVKKGKIEREVLLAGSPRGVQWLDDQTVLVAEYDNGTVARIDINKGEVVQRLKTGPKPIGLSWHPDRGLAVTNYGRRQLQLMVPGPAIVPQIRTFADIHHPGFNAISSDGSTIVTAEMLPAGVATNYNQAIRVWIIKEGEMPVPVSLPGGSNNARHIKISPNGKWAYVVHTRGKNYLPTSQIERGWINTNVFSIIDLQQKEHYASFLFDKINEGAADPWGLALSPDGKKAWVTIAGTHELATINLEKLHQYLEGKFGQSLQTSAEANNNYLDQYTDYTKEFWQKMANDPSRRELLLEDMSVLFVSEILSRKNLPVKGPRSLDVSTHGHLLATAGYFDGKIILMDAKTGSVVKEICLDQPQPDQARLGEMLFYDGDRCYQGWLSCGTCHPSDGRADGQNWDLLNDGIGNPKNNKSMLWTDLTPPSMWSGVRKDYEIATMAGMKHFQYNVPSDEEFAAVKAYLRSLEPEKSPYLEKNTQGGYQLSVLAEKGKHVFEKARCNSCHPAPLYTDLKSYNVGSRNKTDRRDDFDTPTLVELWRTAPYMHDGSLATMEEVVEFFAPNLTPEDQKALVAYLLSL